MGDFNYPEINWSSLTVSGSNSTPAATFLDSCEDVYLVQHVQNSTRFRGGQQPSLLDLVFTSTPEAIDNIFHLAPLGCSDHDLLLWDYLCLYQSAPPTSVNYSWNYARGNYEEFNNYFHQLDWSKLFNNDVEHNWTVLKGHIHRAQELFIPQVMKRANSNKVPWWSKQVIAAVNEKHRAFKRYKATNLLIDYNFYKICRNKAKDVIRQARLNYERELIINIKTRPCCFYSYIRSKKKVKDHIEYLIKPDGTKTNNHAESVEVLAQFFSSVYVEEDTANVPDFPPRCLNRIDSLAITEEDLLLRLSQLNTSKATGPDRIHAWILKEGRYGLCKPLSMLYNLSLDCGKLPMDWKQANVTPIFKKGSRYDPNNYRPVSLTSQVCKILESFVSVSITNFLTQNKLITPYQHGFTKGKKSCLTNLLTALNDWTSSLDNGFGTDVIYLDFQKAFDTVPHYRLIKKLDAYGIKSTLLLWIKDFLNGRLQQVVLNGLASRTFTVSSGVPQGSVLGPLLFLLYVNDIPEQIECNISMFADDAKIYTAVKDIADSRRLQADLDLLAQWAKDWLLRFNVKKCKHMSIGPQSAINSYTITDANDVTHSLSTTDCEKDLGVWISSTLHPSVQCQKSYAKAMQSLATIKRTFESFNILYKTYIQPHIEYCVQAWSPYYAKDIDLLEKVQHRATKLLPQLANLPYQQRIQRLKMYSLYCRRQRGDLIETFKILKRYLDVNHLNFFTLSPIDFTRGHDYKLFKPRSKLLVRSKFFTNRVIDLWNSLPYQVINVQSIIEFKNNLDIFWAEKGYGHHERPMAY